MYEEINYVTEINKLQVLDALQKVNNQRRQSLLLSATLTQVCRLLTDRGRDCAKYWAGDGSWGKKLMEGKREK